jgi:hypothetical protein
MFLRINKSFIKISLLKNSAPILHSLCASLMEEMDILQIFVPWRKLFTRKTTRDQIPKLSTIGTLTRPRYPNKIIYLKLTFMDPRKCGYQKELLDLFCRCTLSHMGARTNGSWTVLAQDIWWETSLSSHLSHPRMKDLSHLVIIQEVKLLGLEMLKITLHLALKAFEKYWTSKFNSVCEQCATKY